jgi:hypothetical protein
MWLCKRLVWVGGAKFIAVEIEFTLIKKEN